MKGLTLAVSCPCGETHRLPLDDSGHYAGPAPCDPTRTVNVQVDPAEWRRLVEAETAKVRH